MRFVYSSASIQQTESTWRATHDDNTLMQQAAFGISRRVLEILRSQYGRAYGMRVLALVGPGDNGGDALWASAYLAERGVQVMAVHVGSSVHSVAQHKFSHAGGAVINAQQAVSCDADVIIDGIFGIGFRGEIPEPIMSLLDALRDKAPIVSIDIPSGVYADTGCAASGHVVADVTCVIGAFKVGVLTGEGKSASGAVELVPLQCAYAASSMGMLDFTDVQGVYPPAMNSDYKYSRGVVYVHAGSKKFPGAGLLTAGAARVTGVGMVQVAGDVASDASAHYPDVVIATNLDRATAIVIGPGESATKDTMSSVLKAHVPVVVDAGALTFLLDPEIQELVKQRCTDGHVTVITPHKGEAAQLGFTGDDRLSLAHAMAQEFSSIVVFKGPGTIICDPNGSVVIDTYGTSALACAGSGDVLAGLIGATLATGHSTAMMSVAGAVALHGLAGRFGGTATNAQNLIESLSQVRGRLVNR